MKTYHSATRRNSSNHSFSGSATQAHHQSQSIGLSNQALIQKQSQMDPEKETVGQEAGLITGKVMQPPKPIPPSRPSSPVMQRVTMENEEDLEEEPLQRKEVRESARGMENNFRNTERPVLQGRFNASEGSIQSQNNMGGTENRTGMSGHLKSGLETLSGLNLSGVRVHYNSPKPAQVNALAYTQGQNIHLGPGQEKHLPHEGWHVVQQMQGRVSPTKQGKDVSINEDASLEREADVMGTRALQSNRSSLAGNESAHAVQRTDSSQAPIQRRLLTFGTLADVNALLGLIGPAAGLTLVMNNVNNQVQITAVLPGAPPSPTARARLTTIINHPTQHAEVVVARGQPLVVVGAFPQPTDLTVTRIQRIDIDDILAIEAGSPGHGAAFAMHEIEENFQAHGVAAVAGVDRFQAAHERAIDTESAVASELVGPGRRVATAAVPGTIFPTFTAFGIPFLGTIIPVANTTAVFIDYENYYLGFTIRFDPATQNNQIITSQRFAKTVISSRTIDNYATGSSAVPAAGAPAIAASAADVAANPTSTVSIQGFTDEVGSAAFNLNLSQQRADAALAALGVPAGRVHAEGLGETNFVAPTGAAATPADRARNRRVVITVTRPQL